VARTVRPRTARSSPKPASRRERERAAHRAEILAAAERVFATRGWAAATMADIAREAEFAVGTLYRFFDSKEELFEELVVEQVSAFEAEHEAALAEAEDVRAALVATALVNARMVARRRGFFALFVGSVRGTFQKVGPELPAVELRVQRIQRRFLARIAAGQRAGELTRAVPAELLATALGAAIRAYSVERVLRQGGEPDEAEVRAYVGALLDGLARPRRTRPTRRR
jgi:AcrR family transcriptional regulator